MSNFAILHFQSEHELFIYFLCFDVAPSDEGGVKLAMDIFKYLTWWFQCYLDIFLIKSRNIAIALQFETWFLGKYILDTAELHLSLINRNFYLLYLTIALNRSISQYLTCCTIFNTNENAHIQWRISQRGLRLRIFALTFNTRFSKAQTGKPDIST